MRRHSRALVIPAQVNLVIPAEVNPVIPAEVNLVIPAEAGIQRFWMPWIPASAGMTGERGNDGGKRLR